MPDRSRAFALFGAFLVPLAVEAATPFSSGTATAAVSTNAWVIPLTGPTATGAPWGINISQSRGKPPTKVPVVLGAIETSTSTSTAIVVDAIAPAGTSNEQLVVVPGASVIQFSNSTSLSVQSGGSSSQNATLPITPLSLNLGYGSSWNGSFVFGGYFDKNRIFSEKWTPTQETSSGNATLLVTGKQSVGTVSLHKFTFQGDVAGDQGSKITPSTPFGNSKAGDVDPNHDATLDFNLNTIMLPSKDYCGVNITITLNPGVAGDNTYSELQIPVPAELTGSDQCTTTNSDRVVLGRPFFQAAMVYVDDGGDIYFNAANRWALPVSLDTFNKDAMLSVPSQPATATQSSTPTPTKSSSATLNDLPSPMWMALVAVSALFFTA
ncbi:hypothetical protein PoHVEF18_008308 [Penicillium ochrochloron]